MSHRTALIDTDVLRDYLLGEPRAEQVLARYPHRAVSVLTWLELMAQAPAELQEATRSFLRSFERLSLSESIADEALRLMARKPGLAHARALTWACAIANQMSYVTADPSHVEEADLATVILAYTQA